MYETLKTVLVVTLASLMPSLPVAQADSPAPQTLVLRSVAVDVGGRPVEHGRAPIELPRHLRILH